MRLFAFTVVVFSIGYPLISFRQTNRYLVAHKLDNTTPTLIPLDVDVDIIRFERNLLSIGFFGANEGGDLTRTTRRIEQEVSRDGRKVKVAAEFRGSELLGLPTTSDRDKFIALLKIINENRDRYGVITNPIRFSGYQMIRELGLSSNGDIYADILRWGKRMADTTITSEQIIYYAAKKEYSDETMHVFRSFKRTGTSYEGGKRQENFEVVLEDWLLANLNQRYVIPEDFNAYKKLKRPTAKGIFGYLHIWFNASDGRPIEKDYVDLCNVLNVRAYTKPSKIRSTIGPSLDELVKIKYLSRWDIQTRVMKNGHKIILSVGSELLQLLVNSRKERKLSAPKAHDEFVMSELQMKALKVLLDQGVLPAKAKSLVEECGAAKVIDMVEYVESQSATGRRKVENPAGLIIYHLDNDLPIPAKFVTSRRRAEIEESRKLQAQRSQTEADHYLAYLQWLDQAVDAEISKRFSDTELKAKIREIITGRVRVDEELRDALRRVADKQKESIALQIIRKEIKLEMALPSFSEWAANNAQGTLF